MSGMTRSDVVKFLCVCDGVLDLVTLTEAVYPVEGCNNLGVQGNYRDMCNFHGKTWFPHARDDQNKLQPNCHGYELLGPEFHWNYKPGACLTCCCKLEVCVAIGYSNHGMFRLPSGNTHLTKFVEKLPVLSENKLMMMEKPRSFNVAPWHFFSPEHRK
eukprot:scaffold156792_cov69-Attheya_sp.AAC.2